MAPRQSKTAKRSKSQNRTRSIESEVFQDTQAKNQLSSQSKQTPKSKVRKPKKQELAKELKKVALYGKRKEHNYNEKDLDIPVLNKAITPGVVSKKGKKKGKKFIADNDNLTLSRLIKQINDDKDLVNESKLEKSRRLEEIRELRKQEMERKDLEKSQKLEDKKSELKNKANVARANRRKNAKTLLKAAEDDTKPKKKSVAFA